MAGVAAEAPVVSGNLCEIEKYITKDGTVRAAAVVATPIIQEMQTIHQSFPVATAAMGRAVIGAGLLASFLKNGARLSFHFKGDGPLGQVFAEGDETGAVRGFVTNPQTHIESKNGKLNVGEAVGKGFLTVATSLVQDKQPYSGTVQIQTGEIGDDIAFYLYQSQQTSSIVALGVFVEPDGKVSSAGGVVVQLMPGATEKTISLLENKVKQMRSMTEVIRSGGKTFDLVAEVLEDFEFRKLDQGQIMRYECQCNLTRVEKALMLLGEKEVKQMEDPVDVRCDFCGRKYSVTQKELKKLFKASQKS